jgi:hypothetical protein
MQPDLLQQLKDIHLPADPTWWPPAPGWWLLLAAAVIAALWLARRLQQAIKQRRPIWEARRLYKTLHETYENGQIDAATYLHEANELLKRLFVHGLHDDPARKANDAAWLQRLDTTVGSTEFTEGPGRQLGNQRFRPVPEADPDALHPLLTRLLKEVRP